MPRPRSWFEPNEYNDARRAAKDRGVRLRKYTRLDKSGSKIQGYFVGNKIPIRLNHASIETK